MMTLNHEEPDKVPVHAWMRREILNAMQGRMGIENPFELFRALGHDLVVYTTGSGDGSHPASDDAPDEFVSDWGITYQKVNWGKGTYFEIGKQPLEDEEALDSWRPPSPLEPGRYAPLQMLIQTYGEEFAIVGGGGFPSLFETAGYLRGLERLFSDIILNKDFVHALLDDLVDHQIEAGRKVIDMGVDVYIDRTRIRHSIRTDNTMLSLSV